VRGEPLPRLAPERPFLRGDVKIHPLPLP
jgi:hypothetical protein